MTGEEREAWDRYMAATLNATVADQIKKKACTSLVKLANLAKTIADEALKCRVRTFGSQT